MTSSREPKEVDTTRQNNRPRPDSPEEDELTKVQIGLERQNRMQWTSVLLFREL